MYVDLKYLVVSYFQHVLSGGLIPKLAEELSLFVYPEDQETL